MHRMLKKAIDQHYKQASPEILSNIPLLYAIQLALLAFLLITLGVVVLLTPARCLLAYLAIVMGSMAVLCVAVALNLRGRYRLALVITLLLMFLGPWASVLFEYLSHSGDFVPMVYVIIPIQIAALFISMRPMLFIAVIQTVTLGFIVVTDPSRGNNNWPSLLCYVFLASMLGTITSYVLRNQYTKMLNSKNALAESERKLRDVSIRDPLSGLYNRRYMDEAFQSLMRNSEHAFSVLMVDVDHFKSINDIYGHSCGDQMIRSVADILSEAIRKNDIACRFGGDEFLLILVDCNLSDALVKAEQIKQQIEAIQGDPDARAGAFMTASIGVAQYPENGSDHDSILKAVDDALYHAKQEGRNRIAAATGWYTAVGKATET